jgi:hypothetical protein
MAITLERRRDSFHRLALIELCPGISRLTRYMLKVILKIG